MNKSPTRKRVSNVNSFAVHMQLSDYFTDINYNFLIDLSVSFVSMKEIFFKHITGCVYTRVNCVRQKKENQKSYRRKKIMQSIRSIGIKERKVFNGLQTNIF